MLLMLPAISNTSPLTNLAVIGQLERVREQLSEVAVPPAVWREMLTLPHQPGRNALLAAKDAGWLTVMPLANNALAKSLRLSGLDEGESEAIALAVDTSARLLLIDEKKGRAAARQLGVSVAGALAIIAAAKKTGVIPSAKKLINDLKIEAGFYVSAAVEKNTLHLAGEEE